MNTEDRDSVQEKDCSRRALLKSGLGAAVAPGLTGYIGAAPLDRAVEPVATPERASSGASPTEARETPDDTLSVREAAEWIDREHTPERLRGNGPPFADRPVLWAETLSTYDGKETLFHPEIFAKSAYDMGMINRTEKSGAVSLPTGKGLTEKGLVESHRWQEGSEDWRSLRTTLERHEQGVRIRCLWLNAALYEGSDHEFERARPIGRAIGKGEYDVVTLCEIRDDRLIDELIKGYEDGQREVMQDTRGPREEKIVSEAAAAKHLGDDIIERWKKVLREEGRDWAAGDESLSGASRDILESMHQRSARVSNASGLVTVIGRNPNESGQSFSLADRNKHIFLKDALIPFEIYSPQAPFKIFTRGYQRHTIDVGGGDDLRGFDIFSTHLEGNQQKVTQEKKVKQLKLLTDAVEKLQRRERRDHRDSRPSIPKIVVGDFNFASDGGGYKHGIFDLDTLVNEFDGIGHYDAWTVHGGPTGDTHGPDIPRSDLKTGEPYPGGDWTPGNTCHCEEFKHGSYLHEKNKEKEEKANRLDYVFVEKPRPRHTVSLDVARMWRIPISNCCPWIDGPPKGKKYDHRLTDHVGIGFEILVTLKD